MATVWMLATGETGFYRLIGLYSSLERAQAEAERLGAPSQWLQDDDSYYCQIQGDHRIFAQPYILDQPLSEYELTDMISFDSDFFHPGFRKVTLTQEIKPNIFKNVEKWMAEADIPRFVALMVADGFSSLFGEPDLSSRYFLLTRKRKVEVTETEPLFLPVE